MEQPPASSRVRTALWAAGAAALFLGAACGTGSTTTRSPSGARTPVAGPTGSPTPSDGRPSCLEGRPGRYVERPNGSATVKPVTSIFVLGSGRRGVVVGAQADGGICQTLAYGQSLARHGYRVALFDWSGMSTEYSRDMRAATTELLAEGATRIVVGGFSRGALVALGTAAELGPQVKGVFAVSGGPSAGEGFATVRSLSTYPGPVLLIAAERDPVFPPHTSARIAAAHEVHGPTTLLMLPGAAHALALLDTWRPRVEKAIDDFLEKRLD